MHTEYNVWLDTLDIIYHEAMQRGTMENFLKVLAGPQTEAKLKIPGLASTTAQTDKLCSPIFNNRKWYTLTKHPEHRYQCWS